MKFKQAFFYILSISIITGCQTKETKKTHEPDKTIKVAIQPMEKAEEVLSYAYSGQIQASRNIRLSFQIPGHITGIYAEEGDQIKAGALLAELDKVKFESAYKAALATYHQSEDAYNRLKKVYDKGSLSEVDWQNIKTKKAQAKSALELAEQNLKDCQLIAPEDGIIGKRNIEAGTNATPNLAVFDLLKMNPAEIKIAVPENEINKLKKGQHATVAIGALGDQTFQAQIEKIGVTANPVSRTYDVKLQLMDQPQNIKVGMLCDVIIYPKQINQVFVLPIDAVLQDENNKNFVYIMNETDNTTTKKYVELDGFTNNQVIIKSGINTQDLVIVSGQNKLSPNTKVRI